MLRRTGWGRAWRDKEGNFGAAGWIQWLMSGDEIIVDELSGWWAAGGLADASKTWELIQLFPWSSRERLRIRQAEMGPDVMKGKLLPDVTRSRKFTSSQPWENLERVLLQKMRLFSLKTPQRHSDSVWKSDCKTRVLIKKKIKKKAFS